MSREIIRHHDADDLAAATAARLVTTIARVQADHGSASVVLTGGRIAGALLFALADPVASDGIDWSRVDLWWGDERFLDSGDDDRNDTLADIRLLSVVDVHGSLVHRIAGPDTAVDAEAAAFDYATLIAGAAESRRLAGRPAFDVVLLSIGPDGHVASLFPESPALESGELALAVHGAPKPPPVRVSMGYAALNDCTEAWLLASGAEKSEVIEMMLTRGAGRLQIPAAGIEAIERTLVLLDESAASGLTADIGKR